MYILKTVLKLYMFVDNVEITVQAGSGGAGSVSFYRDTLTMHGGPDGGNGGHGGNIIFVGDSNINNLVSFHFNQKFKVADGENGAGQNKTGKSGEDTLINVPLGTKIYSEDGELAADITEKGQRFVAVNGGAGGYGNAHFATSTRQTPNFSKTGVKTKPYKICLELNCIADIGLVGFPNVGKSTFLSVVTSARPKIANYHFTTLYPNIGVTQIHGKNILIADIPGLIEGASGGVGLGTDFLKHISRTRILLHVIDISGSEGRDPVADYKIINNELLKYGAKLEDKKQIIVLNKIDCADPANIVKFRKAIKGDIYETSAITHKGIAELLNRTFDELQKLPVPEPIEVFAAIEKPVDKNEFSVKYENGEYVVAGAFVDNLIRGVVLGDTESNNYFQRRLVKMGVIDKLKEIGLTDGGTIRILDSSFTYIE
jgi:GTP-binding protein